MSTPSAHSVYERILRHASAPRSDVFRATWASSRQQGATYCLRTPEGLTVCLLSDADQLAALQLVYNWCREEAGRYGFDRMQALVFAAHPRHPVSISQAWLDWLLETQISWELWLQMMSLAAREDTVSTTKHALARYHRLCLGERAAVPDQRQPAKALPDEWLVVADVATADLRAETRRVYLSNLRRLADRALAQEVSLLDLPAMDKVAAMYGSGSIKTAWRKLRLALCQHYDLSTKGGGRPFETFGSLERSPISSLPPTPQASPLPPETRRRLEEAFPEPEARPVIRQVHERPQGYQGPVSTMVDAALEKPPEVDVGENPFKQGGLQSRPSIPLYDRGKR